MLVLQKYGGSSVADLERIRACADRCVATANASGGLVVVVSAMKGETNRLIAMANALVQGAAEHAPGDPGRGDYVTAARRSVEHDRELDQLVATGEKVSAALLAMAIGDRGGRAVSLAGHQLGMHTDRSFTRAKITDISEQRIRAELAEGRVVVCAGFQGIDDRGDITTLGRGGSDTSAVALAAALDADVCEILTDVDGVYTTDPRIVPRAQKVDAMSYDEMLELASLGAKVLQIRAVAFAKKYGVRVHVRSSLHEGPGTMIVAPEEVAHMRGENGAPSMEAIEVSGVALQRDEAKVTLVGVADVPGVIAEVFGALGAADVSVDMILQNASRDQRTDITFTVGNADLEAATEVLRRLRPGGEALVLETDRAIAKISVVGLGLRSHAEVAARVFSVLATENINVQMVSNSELKMSVVVQERYGELALRSLHSAFGLDAPT
ncbi:MAG: aspartate kinase [Nannocystaceae bacterium]|nr:aspartate kinase [Nannocystaceae bacterium]